MSVRHRYDESIVSLATFLPEIGNGAGPFLVTANWSMVLGVRCTKMARLQCQHAVWFSSSLVQDSTSVMCLLSSISSWSLKTCGAGGVRAQRTLPRRARTAGTSDVSRGVWACPPVREFEHQRVLEKVVLEYWWRTEPTPTIPGVDGYDQLNDDGGDAILLDPRGRRAGGRDRR